MEGWENIMRPDAAIVRALLRSSFCCHMHLLQVAMRLTADYAAEYLDPRDCLLCDAKPNRVGVFVPPLPLEEWNSDPEGGPRSCIYTLCERCLKKPARASAVVNTIKLVYAGLDRTETLH